MIDDDGQFKCEVADTTYECAQISIVEVITPLTVEERLDKLKEVTNLSHLSEDMKQKVGKFIIENNHCFSLTDDDMGFCEVCD